jgi:hypothetical protein
LRFRRRWRVADRLPVRGQDRQAPCGARAGLSPLPGARELRCPAW